jgi:hypothetical protein
MTQLSVPVAVTSVRKACVSYQIELPAFVSAELAGNPVDQIYADLASHLDVCVICLGEYEALADLTASALADEDLL